MLTSPSSGPQGSPTLLTGEGCSPARAPDPWPFLCVSQPAAPSVSRVSSHPCCRERLATPGTTHAEDTLLLLRCSALGTTSHPACSPSPSLPSLTENSLPLVLTLVSSPRASTVLPLERGAQFPWPRPSSTRGGGGNREPSLGMQSLWI